MTATPHLQRKGLYVCFIRIFLRWIDRRNRCNKLKYKSMVQTRTFFQSVTESSWLNMQKLNISPAVIQMAMKRLFSYILLANFLIVINATTPCRTLSNFNSVI